MYCDKFSMAFCGCTADRVRKEFGLLYSVLEGAYGSSCLRWQHGSESEDGVVGM